MELGRGAIEVDVWLVDNGMDPSQSRGSSADIDLSKPPSLLVGHQLRHTMPNRTLQSLYLDPLMTIFDQSQLQSTETIGGEPGDPPKELVLAMNIVCPPF